MKMKNCPENSKIIENKQDIWKEGTILPMIESSELKIRPRVQ